MRSQTARNECWSRPVAILVRASMTRGWIRCSSRCRSRGAERFSQYAGRLHRQHISKRDVVIYDYVDENEPVLMKMARRREAGYRSLGYRAVHDGEFDLTRSLPG